MHGGFTGSRPAASLDSILEAGNDTTISISDTDLLFNGEFKRVGDSLRITGQDGKTVFLADYFKADRLPTLIAPDGGALLGNVVAALAGPRAPGQSAQAGAGNRPRRHDRRRCYRGS
jgi:hypothetical protein